MKKSAFFVLAAMQFPALGKGASPYLPLNLAPEVELQIEKLMAMTGDAPLVKPYKAKEVIVRLESIKDYHPVLYRRLSAYMKRYTQEISNTHRAVILSGSNDNNRALENNRGVKHNANIEVSVAGHVFYNPYLFVSAGASYSNEGGRALTNTHITYGNEYIQMDLGFRDHWFSPFQDSAMLISTQAENTPSVTLSNSTGLTDFNIRYELFYAQMDEDVPADANGTINQGKPALTGMHVSVTPLDSLSVGFSRTYYYGGGNRDDGLGIGLQGLFSPSSLEDNLSDNLEQGYGQTAISAKWNYGKEVPVSIYAEFARFDSDALAAREDSGNAISIGLFLPSLFETMSLRYEVTDRDEGWYDSSFYPQGIRHKQHILGHWGADELIAGLSPGALSHHILLDWELVDDQLLNIRIAQQSFDDVPANILAAVGLPGSLTELENSVQLKARYSFVTRWGFMGLEGTFGKDAFGENYSRLSGFYRW